MKQLFLHDFKVFFQDRSVELFDGGCLELL